MYFRSPAVCDMLWFGLRRRLHRETDHGLRVRTLRHAPHYTRQRSATVHAFERPGQKRACLPEARVPCTFKRNRRILRENSKTPATHACSRSSTAARRTAS
ncbi:unnamed protein product [Ixodes persulcatus]